MRARRLVLLAVAPVVAGLVGLPTTAEAATTYSWLGATSTAWGTSSNWSPSGVPTGGDSVVIDGAVASNRSITGVPAVALQNLSITTGAGTNVSLTGDNPVTVNGSFSWSGGTIDLPLTLAGSGSIASLPANPAKFGGGTRTLTVSGALDVLGPGAASANSQASVELMFDSNLVVTATGELDLANGARVLGNRCCTTPVSTLTNNGTVVASGGSGATAYVDNVGIDLGGEVAVSSGSTLEAIGGPMRAYAGTSLTGGGRLFLDSTSGPNFDPLDPTAPDGSLKLLGNVAMADATELELDSGANLSGNADIHGSGSLVLSGGTIRGRIGVGVPMRTTNGTINRISVFDAAVDGQHGDVRLDAGGTVVGGSELRVHGGARLAVPVARTLTIAPGGKISADGCCTNPGKLAVDGRLVLDGNGPTPTFEWVSLSGTGRVEQVGTVVWDLANVATSPSAVLALAGTVDGDLPSGAAVVQPGGILAITGDYTPSKAGTLALDAIDKLSVGGTARLAGTLNTSGRALAAGQKRVLVTARTVDGTFACTRSPAAVATYSATQVALVGLPGAPGDCLDAVSGKALKATYSGTRAGTLTPPSGAAKVVLKVSLKGKGAKLKLKAGSSAKVKVSMGSKTMAYVVLRLNKGARAKQFTATLDKRATVTVTQVGYY